MARADRRHRTRYMQGRSDGSRKGPAPNGYGQAVNEALDIKRKRVAFRAWHRGTRETDLMLGRFVDAHVAALSASELVDLEAVLDMPDPDLFAWITGTEPVPAASRSPMLLRIIAFHTNGTR